MANFTVVSVSDGAYLCQALEVVAWSELSVPDDPARLSARSGFPERRYRLRVGNGVCLQCVVNGVVGPTDASLPHVGPVPKKGFFSASLAEGAVHPFWYPPTPGRSSIIRARFDWVGHYVIRVARLTGGAELIPFDVETE